MNLASTPQPPYYSVIFTSIKNDGINNYEEVSLRMMELVENQPGFLGVEYAREDLGITVSYWKDLESIKNWKNNIEHLAAQKKGKTDFYKAFKVRIAKVERDYQFI
jgi:heme-degrading monooxygenase HmoA